MTVTHCSSVYHLAPKWPNDRLRVALSAEERCRVHPSALCSQVSGLKEKLQDETSRSGRLSEALAATESQSEERATTISFLKQQVDHLKEEVKVGQSCD